MNVSDYVARLDEHGTAMAASARRAGLDARVRSCPEWTVRDLLQHTGRVHRWAASFVATGRTDPPKGDHELAEPPPDADLPDWFENGHRDLLDTIRDAPDDVTCWTFLPAPTPLTFWARRQAHETAIHRVDAESVDGTTPAVDTAFAVDGIDELLLGFFARPRGRLVSDPPVTLGIRCTDGGDGDAWSVAIGATGRETTRGVARGDCVLTGRAADLYLMLWNRRGTDDIDVSGDGRVLDLWREKARITWS